VGSKRHFFVFEKAILTLISILFLSPEAICDSSLKPSLQERQPLVSTLYAPICADSKAVGMVVNMNLLQPDSWLIRFLTRVCDLLILNLFLILGCMTVAFSGAAITALYDVTLRMIQKKDCDTVKGFLRAVRENFISSVPATILLFLDITMIALLRYALYAETLIFSPSLFILLAIAAVVMSAVLSYLFPLLAHFDNTFLCHLGNAIRLALANLPVTFLITLVNLLPPLLLMLWPNLVGYVAAFWLLIGFAAGAYVNSFYLCRIFGQ